MRILWAKDFSLGSDGHEGGDVFSTRILSQGLEARGHVVVHAAPRWSGRRPFYLWTVREASLFARRLRVGDDPPDVIIAQNHIYPYVVREAMKARVPVAIIARDRRYRCPQFPHEYMGCTGRCAMCSGLMGLLPYPWFRRHINLCRSMAVVADAQVVVSENMANDMRAWLPGTDPVVVYPPMDDGHIPPDWEPRDVVFMGRGHYKGADRVIGIAEELQSTDHTIRVYGRQEPEHARLMGMLPNIELHGFQPQREVYRRARLVIAPGRWAEPTGRGVMEGAWMGVPSVVSDTGGMPEVLGPGGLVLRGRDMDDPEAWAEAIDGIMTEPTWTEYSRRTLAYSRRFASDDQVSALERALEGIR
jgi:glycosyltransferase involved in cell wall biosynthesis